MAVVGVYVLDVLLGSEDGSLDADGALLGKLLGAADTEGCRLGEWLG